MKRGGGCCFKIAMAAPVRVGRLGAQACSMVPVLQPGRRATFGSDVTTYIGLGRRWCNSTPVEQVMRASPNRNDDEDLVGKPG